MYSIVIEETIAIAHCLPGVEVCQALHGHNLKIQVKVSVAKLNIQGMVVDFRVVKDCIKELDHRYLNDIHEIDKFAIEDIATRPVMPTAENIACYLFQRIGTKVGPAIVEYVKVWESDKAYAEYKL